MLPGETRLFAWADPTGIRKLTWNYAANFGEHDLLKVPFDMEMLFSWKQSELKCSKTVPFVFYTANHLYESFLWLLR